MHFWERSPERQPVKDAQISSQLGTGNKKPARRTPGEVLFPDHACNMGPVHDAQQCQDKARNLSSAWLQHCRLEEQSCQDTGLL